MGRLGPLTTEYATERDEEPSLQTIEDSVRWAVRVENSALLDFYFEPAGSDEVDKYYQLLGPHHHLSALTDERTEIVRSLFADYDTTEDELEPLLYRGHPAIDVELPELDAAEHVELVVDVFETVYEIEPTDVAWLERATYHLEHDETETTMASCHECDASAQVAYMLAAYGDDYYRALDQTEAIGEAAYDFVRSSEGWWACADCFDS